MGEVNTPLKSAWLDESSSCFRIVCVPTMALF